MGAEHIKANVDRLGVFDKIFNLTKVDAKNKLLNMNDKNKDNIKYSVTHNVDINTKNNNNETNENAKIDNDPVNDSDSNNKASTKLLNSKYVTNPIFKTFIKATNLPVESKSMITILDMQRKTTEKPKTIEFEEVKDINLVCLIY